MPRNVYKKPCQVEGCRNWAMRGQARCRVHSNDFLGPMGGAPPGNLNALKTGQHAHPLPYDGLIDLSADLVRRPDQLPALLDPVIRSIHVRTDDPYKTLCALLPLLSELLTLVAEDLYQAELDALLRQLPPDRHAALHTILRRYARQAGPQGRLLFFRGIAARIAPHQKKCTGKTTNGTESAGHAGPAPG